MWIKLTAFFSVCILSCSVNAQIVEIPDVNFASWLEINFPDCMDGNMMDTQCDGILNSTIINCSNFEISDLTGIEHFDDLIELNASYNELTTIPLLTQSNIQNLVLRANSITNLPDLPSSLLKLDLETNAEITELPSLPEGLTELILNNCYALEYIPNLPSTLLEYSRGYCSLLNWLELPEGLGNLNISSGGFTSLPELPNSLWALTIMNNPIGNQETFPPNLTNLNMGNCEMTEIPVLPLSLNVLGVGYNPITEMPVVTGGVTNLRMSGTLIDSITTWPNNVSTLSASNGILSYIEYFPNTLLSFNVNNNELSHIPDINPDASGYQIAGNNIECIENMPLTIVAFEIDDNPLSCIPFIPEGVVLTDVDLDSFPICQNNDPVNNPFGCTGGSGFEGYVHLDEDQMCDFNEEPLANIPVKIGQDGAGITYTNSLSNGRYLFQGEIGEYNVGIQTNNLPFTTDCTDPGLLQNVETDAVTPYVTDLNFALRCNGDSDFGIQSVLHDGWVFPGQVHSVNVLAGEISQFYNAHCSDITEGEVTISVNGPAEIYSVSMLSPDPSLITNTSITYELADLTSVDLMTGFIFDLITYTTATDLDQICLEITVESGSDNDSDLDNNYLTYCYQVVNSYDPNNKLVSPMSVEPGFDDWMYYTINFQNTGSAPAFNIRLEDELPANMDLETFQMTNTSHDSYYDINELDLTVYYPDIMLADSTSNEPDSKGYFQFKVKPLTAMIDGETIENMASIFFDFNNPVITNTAITEALLPDGITELNSSSLNIYPNPSNGKVTAISRVPILDICCYDLLGKKIQFDSSITGNKAEISLMGNQPGITIIEIKTSKGVSRIRLSIQ